MKAKTDDAEGRDLRRILESIDKTGHMLNYAKIEQQQRTQYERLLQRVLSKLKSNVKLTFIQIQFFECSVLFRPLSTFLVDYPYDLEVRSFLSVTDFKNVLSVRHVRRYYHNVVGITALLPSLASSKIMQFTAQHNHLCGRLYGKRYGRLE